ncbi:hypothetical protein MSG28_012837 [Choristoneura fumiferana]|uniref:Uncharacterized protein n=1 Tax=Choristoneura fumiferana TaxID=7141 RepID=A0ACC0JID8_CHOFU|nr:hypothetical protein MSG28_012837 [Choristoneura fumiferana]
MSLGARATKGGAGGAGGAAAKGKDRAPDKAKGASKPPGKDKASTDHIRLTHTADRKNDDTSDVRRMVRTVFTCIITLSAFYCARVDGDDVSH